MRQNLRKTILWSALGLFIGILALPIYQEGNHLYAAFKSYQATELRAKNLSVSFSEVSRAAEVLRADLLSVREIIQIRTKVPLSSRSDIQSFLGGCMVGAGGQITSLRALILGENSQKKDGADIIEQTAFELKVSGSEDQIMACIYKIDNAGPLLAIERLVISDNGRTDRVLMANIVVDYLALNETSQ